MEYKNLIPTAEEARDIRFRKILEFIGEEIKERMENNEFCLDISHLKNELESFELEQLFAVLKSKGYTIHYDDCCGIDINWEK